MVGLHGDFSQQRAVLSFLGTPVCLGIPADSAPQLHLASLEEWYVGFILGTSSGDESSLSGALC